VCGVCWVCGCVLGVWGVWGCGGVGGLGCCRVGSLLTFDIPQTALVATFDTYDFYTRRSSAGEEGCIFHRHLFLHNADLITCKIQHFISTVALGAKTTSFRAVFDTCLLLHDVVFRG
jgi:hypothetical protein